MFKRIKKNRKRAARIFSVMALALVFICMMSVFAFAATPDPAITSEMLEPVFDGVKANLAVIVPVGIALFAIILGITLIPWIFSKFKKG